MIMGLPSSLKDSMTTSPVCLAIRLQLPSAVLIAIRGVGQRLMNWLIEWKMNRSAPVSDTMSWFLTVDCAIAEYALAKYMIDASLFSFALFVGSLAARLACAFCKWSNSLAFSASVRFDTAISPWAAGPEGVDVDRPIGQAVLAWRSWGRDGCCVLHSEFECIDRLCVGRWQRVLGSLLYLSPLGSFLLYCTDRAMLDLSMVGFMLWDSVRRQLNTRSVLRFFKSPSKFCMRELKLSRGSLMMSNKSRISLLRLKPGCHVVNSDSLLCSFWVLLTNSSMGNEESNLWNTMALIAFATARPTFSPCLCLRARMVIASNGCWALEMAFMLCVSTVVWMDRSTCARCILHNATLDITVGSGMREWMNSPRPHESSRISRSRRHAM